MVAAASSNRSSAAAGGPGSAPTSSLAAAAAAAAGMKKPVRSVSPVRASGGLRSEYKARLMGHHHHQQHHHHSSPSYSLGRGGLRGALGNSGFHSHSSNWQWGNTDTVLANVPSPRHNKAGSSVDLLSSSVNSSLASSCSLASSSECPFGGSGGLGGGGGGGGASNNGGDSVVGDRFIPNRFSSRLDGGGGVFDGAAAAAATAENLGNADSETSNSETASPQTGRQPSTVDTQREHQAVLHSILREELLGPAAKRRAASDFGGKKGDEKFSRKNAGAAAQGGDGAWIKSASTIFNFKSSRESYAADLRRSLTAEPLSLCGRNLSAQRRVSRKIPKSPFKVLDAPQLQDDFYLNLVDWSSQNVLAVGLGNSVYLWSACTSKVTKLCDLGEANGVSSVSWSQRGSYLSVGMSSGEVQLWDVAGCRKVRSMLGHSGRVGALSWNASTLASGSRDKLIHIRDVRAADSVIRSLSSHRQEVCGLKWSLDGMQLASGGNDNRLLVWNGHSEKPLLKLEDHCAAVKAIAWSPHEHGLLASGGGTADRCIRFWNTIKGEALSCVDTGSQVCNLMWATNINELVSTHGYSQHQVVVWRYPSLSKVATLVGHTYRVLYLAMSPDGRTIVTGAGDETLRFWSTFPGPKSKDTGRMGVSPLKPAGSELR